MSRAHFEDDCPGCRPALLGLDGKRYSDESPEMQAVLGVWAKMTRPEREVYHRACCLNSREPADLRVMRAITDRIKLALDKIARG